MVFRVRILLSILILCFAFAGCTAPADDVTADVNGDTPGDTTLDTTSDCPLGGAAVKDVINAATVTIYTVDTTGANETSVGTATTDTSGVWSAAPTPCADDGIYRVEVTDGTYTSEATKNSVTNTVSYTALVDTGSVDIAGSAESLAITPVSTFIDERAANILAQSKAGFGKGRYAAVTTLAEAIATATTEVKKHFGLTENPLTIDVNFTDPTAVTTNPEGTKLGLILGAMTEQAKTFADPGNFITALITDFADGTFDGLDATGAAITVSDPDVVDATLAADAGTTGFTTALDDYINDADGTGNVFADSDITLDDVSDIVSDVTTGVETTVAAGDTTAPTVLSKSPAADATGVAVTTTVTATFSEAILASTITDTSFTLTEGATAVAGAVTYDSATKTATFTPTTSLLPGTTYTVALTVAMTDSEGNALAATTWSFTTGTILLGGEIQGFELSLTNKVTTFAGSTTILYGYTNGTGTDARFYNPYFITTDGTSLFVSDTDNHTIRKIDITTQEVTTVAGGGGPSAAALTNGNGTDARFDRPHGITTDGTNLYVVDYGNNVIRQVTIASPYTVTTLAGTGAASGNADGEGDVAEIPQPVGITTDGTNLYVTEWGNNVVRKIVIATGFVSTIAGAGYSGSTDGDGTAAEFYWPSGITTDGTNLYVADYYNHRIRQITLASPYTVTTLAGSTPGLTDDTGPAAQFYLPFDVTTDGVNLYVADEQNYRIRKIVIASGAVSTIAGQSTYGYTDNTGALAQFYSPSGLTTDGTSLFIADSGNNKIRKIE